MNFVKQALKEFLMKGRESCLYFDRLKLRQNAQFLQSLSALPRMHFLFPVKSFPHVEMLKEIAPYLGGFDISHPRERELAAPFAKASSVFWNSAPYVQDSAETSDHYTDYSSAEVKGSSLHRKALRVFVDPGEKKISRFGTLLSELTPGYIRDNGFSAIHVHHGMENAGVDVFFRMMKELLPFAESVEALNFGGGFARLSREEITSVIKEAHKLFPNQDIFFEPGRWMTEGAGLAMGRVLDVNKRKDKLIVTTSLSRDGHLKWNGSHTRFRLQPMGETPIRSEAGALITGPTCDEFDLHLELPSLEAAKGDIVIFEEISGYSVAWNHSFNGIPEAAVVFLGEDT